MTLDEHIHKAEEDAKMAEFDTEWGIGNYFIDRTEALEYAKECRQLAEWLRDYKRLLEQEPCEDVISRQAVLDTISELNAISFYEAQEDSKECYYAIRQAIKDLSPVKPQTGHWIYDRTRDWDGECKYECSECGMGSDVDYAYCMRCGARMVKPQKTKQPEISSYYGLKSYVRERSDKE